MKDPSSRILEELESYKPEEVVICSNPVPEKVIWEDYVPAKAQSICNAVRKSYGSKEWYGLLTAEKKNPYVIKDIALGEQEVRSSYVSIESEKIGGILKDIDKEYTVVGWIHSHGDMDYMNFSGTDEENKMTVANSITLNTQVISKYMELRVHDVALMVEKGGKKEFFTNLNGNLTKVPYEDIKKYPVDMILKENRSQRILDLDNIVTSKIKDVKLLLPYKVGWSYNVLVNDKGCKTASVTVSEEFSSGRPKVFDKTIGFGDPIASGRAVDTLSLEAEIKKKVKPYSFLDFDFFRRKDSGRKPPADAYQF
jgi:hypothetical protein